MQIQINGYTAPSNAVFEITKKQYGGFFGGPMGQEVGSPNFFTSLSRTSLVNNVISDKKEDCNNKKVYSFCLYSCFILKANYGYILI